MVFYLLEGRGEIWTWTKSVGRLGLQVRVTGLMALRFSWMAGWLSEEFMVVNCEIEGSKPEICLAVVGNRYESQLSQCSDVKQLSLLPVRDRAANSRFSSGTYFR